MAGLLDSQRPPDYLLHVSKTIFVDRLECEWSGQSIVILGSVRIDPPYTSKDCRSLDGDLPGMDRALLMVGPFNRASVLCKEAVGLFVFRSASVGLT